MNRAAGITGIVALLAVAAMPAAAGQSAQGDAQAGASVDRLLETLQVGEEQQKEDAAFTLGEMKASEAVIPLERMLHEDNADAGRTVAALALCRIGDPLGVFAVERAVTFDPSKRVQEECAWFYNEYVHPGMFAFIPAPESAPTFGAK